jgi:16S rRNA (cytosine967-C5)-methyltransferase
MKKTSLIGHCIELHDAVLNSNYPADNTVKEFCRKRHYLGSKDRRFITDVVYGLLRNHKLLQATVDESFNRFPANAHLHPGTSIALYAAYAQKILGEATIELVPDIAELWSKHHADIACGTFLDALTQVDVVALSAQDHVRRCALEYSFPDDVVGEWIRRFGVEETDRLCRALNEPALPVLRVNTIKTTVEECQHALQGEGIRTQRTHLSPVGLLLEKRINAQALHTYTQGFFEIQDEGSQLISQLLDAEPGVIVVDACAGGGGKTLHIAATMNNTGSIIAIDVQEARLKNIRQRIDRAGVSIVQLYLAGRDQTQIDQWIGNADAVLIDAPCSGAGTLRRNPWLKMTLSKTLVERMSATQRSVLETYSQFVKPGGKLVYATCTLLEEENEKAVEWFLAGHPEFSLRSAPEILEKQGIRVDGHPHFLTLLPHRTATDGFFAALMVKQL